MQVGREAREAGRGVGAASVQGAGKQGSRGVGVKQPEGQARTGAGVQEKHSLEGRQRRAQGVLMQSSIGCGCTAGRGKVQDVTQPDMLAERGAGKEQGGCGCAAAWRAGKEGGRRVGAEQADVQGSGVGGEVVGSVWVPGSA